MATYDAVIAGGGNMGLWTAYFLAQRGLQRIALCERYWLGFGATTRSAGVVRQQGGSETAIKLGKWSRGLYLQLGRELGLDSGFTETGYYILAETAAEKEAFLQLVELRRRCGVQNDWVDVDEGRRRFPAITWTRFLGATYTPDDGYVHPPIAARNISFAVLKSPAVTVFEMCPVEDIEVRSGHYVVGTPRGTLETERVIDAGGPRGARGIGAMLDIEVPVSAARHEIVTIPVMREGISSPFPMFFVLGKGYYIRPEEQGALVGLSNPEERADPSERFQIDFDWGYYESLKPDWEAVFPAIAGQPICRAWAASIDFTPDHLPIIDQPRRGFYVLAAGGHGMMWGPALGMKMAELVMENTLSDVPEDEVRLSRSAGGRKGHDLIALPFPGD